MYEIKLATNPKYRFDVFFFKNLKNDKNKLILFGKDPLTKEIKVPYEEIINRLSLESKFAIRKSLDNDNQKIERGYHLFKTVLRLMLIDNGYLEKKELLPNFKNKFKSIELPKNSGNIIINKLTVKDFKDILQFSEDCLRFLLQS